MGWLPRPKGAPLLGCRGLTGRGAGYVRSVADVSQEQAGAAERQATWQGPRLPGPGARPGRRWLAHWAPRLRPACSGGTSEPREGRCGFLRLRSQPATLSSLAPGPPPAVHPSSLPCPLGSNRSSHGQNTISFNKLNLLRLLITSGVGSDQRQRGGCSPPGPCGGGGRESRNHTWRRQITTWPRAAGSHSNRSAGRSGQHFIR